MPKPDPATEADLVRADLRYLIEQAAACQDADRLKQLQTYLVGWIHKHLPKEEPCDRPTT